MCFMALRRLVNTIFVHGVLPWCMVVESCRLCEIQHGANQIGLWPGL